MTSSNQKIEKDDFADGEKNSEESFRFRRLKSCVEAAGGNAHVAALSGIAASTLSAYMNGGEWKVGVALKIADACETSLRWLLFGDDNAVISQKTKLPVASNTDEDRISVRLVNVEASAGHGMTPSNIEEYASIDLIRSALPPHVLSRLNHLVGVTVRGDSMQPTLYDNDIIFVDTQDTDVIPGCVYVLRRDHDFMVKRLTWSIMGDLIVSSDNPRYPSETIDANRARALFEAGGSPVQVMGRVLWKTGTIGSL